MKPGEFISATELRHQACGQLDAVAAPVHPMDPGRVYVTPSRDHWPDLLLGLAEPEARSLAIVDLYCDFKRQRGQKGTAPVSNYKKLSVVRAEWRSGRVEDSLPTDRARAAYAWLLRENPTYGRFIGKHEQYLQDVASGRVVAKYIPTARLLLHEDGIEVAARPWLYPHECFGDSDLKRRLFGVHLAATQLPNIKRAYLRKCLSRCLAYNNDPLLIFLIYDIYMARSIMSTLTLAEKRGLSPETLADNNQYSSAYWQHEQDYLCDVVRQMVELSEHVIGSADPSLLASEFLQKLWEYCHPVRKEPRRLKHPNVFITLAPAEWMFPLHALFQAWKTPDGFNHPGDLSEVTGLLALHLYNVLKEVLDRVLAGSEFFSYVFQHVIRVEFQGRGTLHVHIALWALLYDHIDLRGTTGEPHDSPLIKWLELHGFQTVNVQYGDGFLNYINGYTAKSHDSLVFELKEHIRPGSDHKWGMTYRLLCKNAVTSVPLCPVFRVPVFVRCWILCG